MGPNKSSTMIEESLDDVLRHSFHNAQIGIQSVLNNALEQVSLYLLRKHVFRKTLDAHVAKVFTPMPWSRVVKEPARLQ